MTPIRALVRGALPAAVLLSAACSSTTIEIDVDPQVIEELTFAPSLGIDLADYTRLESSGIYIRDFQEGEGDPVLPQDQVTVEYQAWLADGTLVYEGERTWQFGNFEQPLGMEYGTLHMRVGGVRRMIVPPALAWGDFGSADGRVPPGAVVIFEVEVLERVTPG